MLILCRFVMNAIYHVQIVFGPYLNRKIKAGRQETTLYPVNVVSCLLYHLLDSPDAFCHVGTGRRLSAESLNLSDFVFHGRKGSVQVLHWKQTQQIKL